MKYLVIVAALLLSACNGTYPCKLYDPLYDVQWENKEQTVEKVCVNGNCKIVIKDKVSSGSKHTGF